jgi:hypothetical protein
MKRVKNAVKQAGKSVKAKKSGKAVKAMLSQLLQTNEVTIARAASSFLEIGKALKAIRDQEQYKAARFKNFEAYCEKKWNYSKSYASRLIGAYDAHELLKAKLPARTVLPNNEYQLRALAALPESKWGTTWKRIVKQAKGKPVTGETVESVVRAILHPKGAGGKSSGKANKPAAASKLDKIGKLVKKGLSHKGKHSATKLLELLRKIQRLVAAKSS